MIKSYLENFNSFVYEAGEIEFWFARDLQNLLGYSNWENFLNVIKKAKIACQNSGAILDDNFAETSQAISMPNGAIKEINDIFLSRYACYLIAQNSDSSKEQVAFAMSYFAIQTRKQELLEKRIVELERLQARDKLSSSEKGLSGLIYECGMDGQGFAVIKSKGDQALFGGVNTGDMKKRLGVPGSRALADFLPTITIKAKDFANEITIFNFKKDKLLFGLNNISQDHVKNNYDVRKLLLQKGIVPELLPVEEDTKKVKRRLDSDDKKLLKKSSLSSN